MEGYVLFVAMLVWAISFNRLPRISFPQVNMVQRFNFATLNASAVILIYILLTMGN
jgi:hypothetical protein